MARNSSTISMSAGDEDCHPSVQALQSQVCSSVRPTPTPAPVRSLWKSPRGAKQCSERSVSLGSRGGGGRRTSQLHAAKGGSNTYDVEAERKKDRELSGQHSVMSWLGWSPKVGSPCYQALHTHFPGALPASVVHARIVDTAVMDYGCTPANTLFGCSTCPDEINSEKGGLVAIMEEHWGELFPMGGIGGIPAAGKTGFIAFSHHVPDDGNVMVLFGPHVGITEDGEVSKTLRCGQKEISTACGAVVAAYKACLGENAQDAELPEFDPKDMQIDWIKQHLKPYAEEISQDKDPMATLAHQMYELVEEEVLKVVNTKFGTGRLFLVGGIMINMPSQHSMHFLPRFFEVRREGEAPQNLMASFECRASDPCLHHLVDDATEALALKAKILGSLKLFEGTSIHERMKAARSLVQMSYYKSETIVNQGDIGNTYCILVHGEVAVEVDGKLVKRMSGILRLDDDDIEDQVRNLREAKTLPATASFGDCSIIDGGNPYRPATIIVTSRFAVVDMMTRAQFLSLHNSEGAQEVVDTSTIGFNFPKEREKDSAAVTSYQLFAHVGWSPSFDAECFRTLHEYFPGALPSHAVHSRILEAVSGGRFGLNPSNTIFGTSICPDEINTRKFTLPQLMKSHWGRCFPLGGISGTPFAGKTGFAAFSHHVPDDGNVLVLFGPHVGVSSSGEVGKVHREGQKSESTSCGAVVAAYKACLDTTFASDDFDFSDMQISWIKSQIGPKAGSIKAFQNPLAMLSHFAYEMVKKKLKAIVNNNFSDGYLVLIGGIQINMPEPYCEHFLPCLFEVSKRGEYGFTDLKSVFDTPN